MESSKVCFTKKTSRQLEKGNQYSLKPTRRLYCFHQAQKEESLEMFRKREKELEDWLRENENMEEMGPDELLRPTLALPQQ
mmetsp:Transcript_35173/g.91264  ORF Transcript_35173/g.91264 Transcript_35173/m.91264 type:complete len:81 (+) Transcript_35173:975-1217(+)